MATEVISTIRASGGDYTTLTAWEAAEQKDLVSADEIAVAECYNDWPSGNTGNVSIDGWTTDATRYIEVRPASGNGHDGIDPTSGFYIKLTANVDGHVVVRQSYTKVHRISVVVGASYAGDRTPFIIQNSGVGIVVDGCIATDPDSLNYGYGFASIYIGSGVYSNEHYRFRNCLAIDCANGFRANITSSVENCTAVGRGTGYGFLEDNSSSRSLLAKNSVAYNFGTNWGISGIAGCANNAASDGSTDTPPGADPYTSDVVSGDFVDAAGGDFHLASGSGLIGQGVNLYIDFTTDIDGDTWPSSGAWDIGFDYFTGGGGAVTLSDLTYATRTANSITPRLDIAYS